MIDHLKFSQSLCVQRWVLTHTISGISFSKHITRCYKAYKASSGGRALTFFICFTSRCFDGPVEDADKSLFIDLNFENYTNDLRQPHGLSCCFWAGFASFWDASNVLKLWMWTWSHVLIKPILGCSG